MRSLRRLSVVSIALLSAILLCSASARAQAAAEPSMPPPTNAAQLPPLLLAGQPAAQPCLPSTAFRLPPVFKRAIPSPQPLDSIHTVLPLNTQQVASLSHSNGVCYSLRTYGFTSGHDLATAPRLTSSTTCTPASGTHVKELVKSPSNH